MLTLDIEAPLEVANWRPLVQWLLAVPHYVVLYALSVVLSLFAFISWFAILFTGAIPPTIHSFQVMVLRYQWRVYSYAGFVREGYPPFDFTSADLDPRTDPARLSLPRAERLSRGLIFVKWLLIIPHAVVLFFVGIGAFVAWLIAAFAVLFTGRWPQPLRDLVVGTIRWQLRVNAYVYLLTDQYPPFSLT
ncbi:MAG TPA: DUF4389 domain-containing protein [Acidimicrobiales bacterium]|nr:DUF4389 domain-containing protein [Acidimicrobiales bacterium]